MKQALTASGEEGTSASCSCHARQLLGFASKYVYAADSVAQHTGIDFGASWGIHKKLNSVQVTASASPSQHGIVGTLWASDKKPNAEEVTGDPSGAGEGIWGLLTDPASILLLLALAYNMQHIISPQ